MNEYIIKFTNEMKKKELSANTIEAYKRDINKFDGFLNLRKEKIEDIDVVSIMAYVQALRKNGSANSSIIRNLVSIRSFYKYLMRIGEATENPLIDYEIPKSKRNLPEILTVDEVDKLLAAPDLTSFKGVRDRAMLELMYAAGIKVSELLALTIFDVNVKLGYIKCKGTKNKERIVPIGSYAINCLKKYLQVRDNINSNISNLLFFNLRGGKMTRQGFWKIVKEYAKEAKINKRIDSYTLRHSFAVHLLQNGADMKCVQELLGHNSIATTQIYSGITKQSKIVDVYKTTHPRA